MLDIDADTSGDVTGRLRPYDVATNRALIERSVRRIRGQLPAGAIDMMVAYPSALACQRALNRRRRLIHMLRM